jgi:hypothetical protein
MTDPQRNTGEFHKADPTYRRRMQILLVLVLVLGAAGLAALHFWLGRMGTRISAGDVFGFERSLHLVLGGVCLLLGVTAAAFATWLFKLAAATRAERRWPPSGMRTSADVRIRYLTSADSMVVLMKGGAIALALIALALLGWGAWLLKTA